MCRRSSDDGRGSRKGPLEEGASPAAEAASGGRHPDPYMHEDPYMVSIQCFSFLLNVSCQASLAIVIFAKDQSTHSLTHPLTHPPTPPPARSPARTPARPPARPPPTHPPTHPPTRSLTHSLTTHPPTHLTPISAEWWTK